MRLAATLLPAVQPSGGANDFDTPTNAGIGAQLDELGLDAESFGDFGFDLPDRLGLTTYSVGADFAYELDFWGRDRNTARAAGAERQASESDFQTARIGVLAETVRTYLEIADLRRQRMLTGEMIGIAEEREQLAMARYDRGLVGAAVLYSARRGNAWKPPATHLGPVVRKCCRRCPLPAPSGCRVRIRTTGSIQISGSTISP